MQALIFTLCFVFSFSVLAEDKGPKAEALKFWESRDIQESLEQALIKFEQLEQDLEVLTYLTRGHYLLADLHLTKEDQKMKKFEKAREYGLKGMALNEGFKSKMKEGIEEAIYKLTEKEVAITYWTAASTGKWAKLNGIMSSLRFKPEILAMVKRVEKLEPKFYHGAVPRYWGGFYAVAPSIAGGDMDKSKQNFKEAISVAPDFLANKVLFAELYWTKKGDKSEFKQLLEEVIKAPEGPVEIRPENKMEKRKAERLLKNIENLF